MIRAPLLLVLALAVPPPAATPPATAASPGARAAAPAFGPEWTRLVGEWSGEGGGAPGAGSGGSSFRLELGGHVLVRRNVSDYPAAGDRPATHHEDLLVVSPGASPARGSAVYFDDEGHVIRYDAAWSADGSVLTFLSAEGGPGPRFRLTYAFSSADTATVTFEIAPAGGAFRKYVEGVVKRAPGR